MTNEEMFEQNIKIAYKIAWQYKNCGIDFEDLKQIACLGLWKAIQTFDNKRTLSTYAYTVIQNEINQYLRKNRKYFKDKHLSEPIGVEDITLEETLPDEINNYETMENKIDLENYLKTIWDSKLSVDTKKIIKMYLDGCTQQNIAKEMNCSQAKISRALKSVAKIDKGIKKRRNINMNNENHIKENSNDKLVDLNSLLFKELNTLMDDSLTQEQLDKEIKISKQVVSVSQTIINNAELLLKAKKYFDETETQNTEIAPLLRLDNGKDI